MRRNDEDLPDGWIRTPLPPRSRDDGPGGRDRSWFARTGEPAPQREQVRPETTVPETQKLAVAVLVAGIVAALGMIAAWLLLF